jgi:hypothetical protein
MNSIAGNWNRIGATAVLGLALLFGVGGCASSRNRSAAQSEQDQALAVTVRDALAASPVYKYSGVHVTADSGTVELHGVVLTLAQKQAAGDIARRVPGVAKVENDLSIAPLAGTPDFGATVPPARPPYYLLSPLRSPEISSGSAPRVPRSWSRYSGCRTASRVWWLRANRPAISRRAASSAWLVFLRNRSR